MFAFEAIPKCLHVSRPGSEIRFRWPGRDQAKVAIPASAPNYTSSNHRSSQEVLHGTFLSTPSCYEAASLLTFDAAVRLHYVKVVIPSSYPRRKKMVFSTPRSEYESYDQTVWGKKGPNKFLQVPNVGLHVR